MFMNMGFGSELAGVLIRTLIKTQAASPLLAAKALSPKALKSLERAKGFEPSTPTLARFGSIKIPI